MPDRWFGLDFTVSAFDLAIFHGNMEVAMMLLQAGHIPSPLKFAYHLRTDDEEYHLGWKLKPKNLNRAIHVLPALVVNGDDVEPRDSVARLHSVFRSCSHLLPEVQQYNPLRSTLVAWRAAARAARGLEGQ